MSSQVNGTFDFRSDTPKSKNPDVANDPDALSPTLRKYHLFLWSKLLPNGKLFNLDASTSDAYLHHKSDLGEFFLSSDTANSSYKQVQRLSHIRNQIPIDEIERFRTLIYSIGNMIVFPGRRINGHQTLNQARGCNGIIGDRFDLTLECIRRHFVQEDSPLSETMNAFAGFFDLFGSFQGYVDFFHLRDLVTENFSAIRFYLPFNGFEQQSPYPDSIDAFREYFHQAGKFIQARNQRISEYAQSQL